METRLRAVVVGAGPAGGVLASFLIHGGHQVVLIDSAQSLPRVLRERGLRVSGAAELHVPVWRVYASLRSVIGWDPDLVFVATKAAVVPRLIPHLEGVAGETTLFVSYQNGIDTEEPLLSAFGPERVLRAVVRYGANVVEPGHLRLNFWHRPNYLGGFGATSFTAADPIARAMCAAGLPTEPVADIHTKVWEKAITNALNAICGLTGLSIGGVLDIPPLRETFVALLKERIAIARAAGFPVRERLLEDLILFHEKARDHTPSSYADIQAGLPGEVEWIEGKFVEYARRFGVPAPIDQTILGLVKGRALGVEEARAALEGARRTA